MAKRKDPGGITPSGDAENQRVKGISDVAKTVNQMQKNVDTEIMRTETYIEERKDIQEIQSSMNGVLRKLGETISALTAGVKNVTSSAAIATKDAISQYGRAIGEDIHLKKQNIVAMALARSTPIFGYFAAKFMETDVFKKAASKMREQVGKAFSGVASFFRRGGASKENGSIPHMQHGGYVERGGLAQLHPAEVVMPIDEILNRIDENMSVTKQLAIVARKSQLQALGSMSTYVQIAEKKQRVGLVKGFLRAYAEVNSQYLEPDSKRQLRALLAIQDALGAQIGTWRQVWQKMLVEHPLFRNIMFIGRTLTKAVSLISGVKILYQMWKVRGSYRRILSKSRQPLVAMTETLGSFAIENLWRLDNIALYTRLTAQATRDMAAMLTGKRYKAVQGLDQGYWRIMNILTWPLGKIYSHIFKRYLIRPLDDSIRRAILGKSGERQKLLGLYDLLTTPKNIYKLPGFWKQRRIMEISAGATESTPFMLPHKREPIQISGRVESPTEKMKELEFKYYKSASKVFPLIEKKILPPMITHQAKLLAWRKEEATKLIPMIAQASDEQNKRSRRQSIIKWLLIAGGFIKSLFGGILKPFTMLLGKKGLLFSAARIFASPAAFAKFLGPAGAVLGAGAIGYGLGTVIERSLIVPIRERYFSELDAAKRESGTGAQKAMTEFTEARERVQAGKGTPRDKELMKAYGKTQGQFSAMAQERAKYIKGGFMERMFGDVDVLNIVTDAQSAYFTENFDQYMPYGSAEILRVRAKFMKEGRGLGIDYSADPVKAGRKREEMLLAYLKKHGSIQYGEMFEPGMEYKVGMGYRDLRTKAEEISSAAVEKSKMVATEVQQELAKTQIYSDKIVQNIDKMAEKVTEGGKQQVNAINNMSTSFVNNMNNSMSISVAAGRKGLGEIQEDLTSRILHGRMH